MLGASDIISKIWLAAVANPLNPRIAGSLNEHRRKISKLGIDVGVLDTPEWWKRLEEIGFLKEESGESGE